MFLLEELINVYSQLGATGLLYILFICLMIWIVKKYDRNEEKLYNIIDTLSTKFESIETTLNEIKLGVNKGGYLKNEK